MTNQLKVDRKDKISSAANVSGLKKWLCSPGTVMERQII